MTHSQLREYLDHKRQAILVRREKASTTPPTPHTLSARVRAEGRSGLRRIRIRDFQVISDSGPDFAGFDLGPSSPELQLGVLGSCLTHIFLIQAADREIPLDAIEVQITGQMDGRAGKPGYETIPIYPHEITYTVHISSPASDETLAELHTAVERACPILNLLANPQQITGRLERHDLEPSPASV